MGLRSSAARFATIACALGLFLGFLSFAYFALADGFRTRRLPQRPPQHATQMPEAPEVPSLSGGVPDPALSGDFAVPVPPLSSAPAEFDPCSSLQNAYLAISQATQGADIDAINVALAEVESDPAGLNTDPSAPTLANRLRVALRLAHSSPPCEPVQEALQGSVQLAQIASMAGPEGPPTGAIGDPPPFSPSYRWVPVGLPGGGRGHGYCVRNC